MPSAATPGPAASAPSPPLRSLYARLGLALFGLLVVVGIVWVSVSLITTRIFMQEVNQELDREVAAHLVDEIPLMEAGEVRAEALEELFHMMMVANPSIEIYLLDRQGGILAFSAPPGVVKLSHVDLAPVHRFLEGPSDLPVTGVDPRNPGLRKAFSAAPIERDGGVDGYLYVVLGGQQYDSAVAMLRGSHVLRLGLASLAAALLLALAIGLILFYRMTRRLHRLAAAMNRFEGSDFTEPVTAAGTHTGDGDEIDRLD
ncbi:MAG: sensor histidine kinase, partial [Thermoanaerobaculia bacterium]|nr:sensor histidine kinase [Thermoanaerobaculia bacterium]